jgi:nucleoside-diphosphate-sugar epimerase
MMPDAPFTVLGATGFIGRHLAERWRGEGRAVFAPARGDRQLYSRPLGHVVYAIGITADFRTRPFETMEAHVSVLADILRRTGFDSFTYLSSTRVYAGAPATAETAALRVSPSDPNDLYNLSKLAGEALCLAQPDERIRVARLSNVYGRDMDDGPSPSRNFLAAVIREAALDGEIRLRTAPASAKDYVAVEDVGRAVQRIALGGRERIYNVAAGRNVTHAAIADAVSRITGCRVTVAPGAPETVFPVIDTGRIAGLFTPPEAPWRPADLLEQLPRLLSGPLHARAVAGGIG